MKRSFPRSTIDEEIRSDIVVRSKPRAMTQEIHNLIIRNFVCSSSRSFPSITFLITNEIIKMSEKTQNWNKQREG